MTGTVTDMRNDPYPARVSDRPRAPFGPARPRPEFIATREAVRAVEPVSGQLLSSDA